MDYTPVRYVKKPGGARPGMVVYTTYETAQVSAAACWPSWEISILSWDCLMSWAAFSSGAENRTVRMGEIWLALGLNVISISCFWAV